MLTTLTSITFSLFVITSFPLININHLDACQALAIHLFFFPFPPSLPHLGNERERTWASFRNWPSMSCCVHFENGLWTTYDSDFNAQLRVQYKRYYSYCQWLEWLLNVLLKWIPYIQIYVNACFLMKFLCFSLLRGKIAHLVCQHPLPLYQPLNLLQVQTVIYISFQGYLLEYCD